MAKIPSFPCNYCIYVCKNDSESFFPIYCRMYMQYTDNTASYTNIICMIDHLGKPLKHQICGGGRPSDRIFLYYLNIYFFFVGGGGTLYKLSIKRYVFCFPLHLPQPYAFSALGIWYTVLNSRC